MTVTTSSQLGPLGVGTPTGSPPPPAPFLVLGPSAHGIQYPFGALNALNTTATFTVNGGLAAANTLGCTAPVMPLSPTLGLPSSVSLDPRSSSH